MADSYIVHVYRRSDGCAELVGLVERAGGSGRAPFHTPEELWHLLCADERMLPDAERPPSARDAPLKRIRRRG